GCVTSFTMLSTSVKNRSNNRAGDGLAGGVGVLLILPVLLLGFIPAPRLWAQSGEGVAIARVKYDGGGDWYNDRSAEVNLLRFIAERTSLQVRAEFEGVELTSDRLFSFPVIFLTGHGNVSFSAT